MRNAVVSDIHANWDALEAVLLDAGEVDQVWCLGDIVDGGPEPNECVSALRARDAICICGNHEDWVLRSVPERLRGTPLESWARWTYSTLTGENRAFLEALPAQALAGDFTLLHYPHEGLNPPVPADLACFRSRYCLVGHTHVPLVCTEQTSQVEQASLTIKRPSVSAWEHLNLERTILNVGSVGRSFIDPRLARYLLIEIGEPGEKPAVTFRAVPYAIEQLSEKLQSCGVPADLAAERRQALNGSDSVRERAMALHRAWYPEMREDSARAQLPHQGDE